MTAAAIEPQPVPLVRDDSGRLMVTETRVSLDVLVADFTSGLTPEAIHEAYGCVSLADVYAVLAYYLRHRPEVEVYLAEQRRDAEQIQMQIEAAYPAEGMRAKLLARLDP